jgi:hypothetical protein
MESDMEISSLGWDGTDLTIGFAGNWHLYLEVFSSQTSLHKR